MRKRQRHFLTRVAAFGLALHLLAAPAFAIVREVEVYGAKSINDMGESDHRVTMDDIKEDYHDFVQTDTLREYFHRDKDRPTKVDLDQSLSWLIDNNIISRDQTITVSNVKPNEIPEISIDKFEASNFNTMTVNRTNLLMYVYKAVYGPIKARTIAVETDNVRVDDGEYITLYDLMVKNGYNPDPNTHLPGSGLTTIPGANGAAGGTGGGAGSKGGDGGDAEGTDHQTNYLDDFGNWRYQPQGDLWESIFGDTNIFISQNNFQQQITGGNGGAGGGGGAGVGTGGSGGGGGVTNGTQDMMNNTSTGDNTQDTFDSHDEVTGGNAGNSGDVSGTGHAGDNSVNTGGGGGGGGAANTGDNFIDYDTDYKQIYFIPGADMLFYENTDVPEVYIQAALSQGIITFDSDLRSKEFDKEFVEWVKDNPNTRQSWDWNSPAYVVNRTKNILRTVSDTEQVATQFVLGTSYNVSWENSTLTIQRLQPFADDSGYFELETVTKMDAYRYIYHFLYDHEKSLSDLERDIVNYKYGMELDGITNEEDTGILKYLIAKGILNYDNTSDMLGLSTPLAWSDFLILLRRVADKDYRLDFDAIQLTDSEAQWKAKGYAPQTQHIVAGEKMSDLKVMTFREYSMDSFGSESSTVASTMLNTMSVDAGYEFTAVASQATSDGRRFVRFGSSNDSELMVSGSTYGDLLVNGLNTRMEGAVYNSRINNGDPFNAEAGAAAAVSLFDGYVTLPSSNIGKYALSLFYQMVSVEGNKSVDRLSAQYWDDWKSDDVQDVSNPELLIFADIIYNVWALDDMQLSGGDSDIDSIIEGLRKWADDVDKGKKVLGDSYDAFVNALDRMEKSFNLTRMPNGLSRPRDLKFMFYKDGHENVTTHWVEDTEGIIDNVINRIEAIQYTILGDHGSMIPITYNTNVLLDNAETRRTNAVSDKDFISNIGNSVECRVSTIMQNFEGKYWTEEQKAQAKATFSNTLSSFALLSSVNTAVDILTYIDPDTNEAYVTWSTLERYKQQSLSDGTTLPIERKSDYVLYNTLTQTYAYFNPSNSQQGDIALVGCDIVRDTSHNGVVYRDGTEVYYLIEAVRLLLDAKQEAEVLGSLRGMPVASEAVQNNISRVQLDDNSGATKVAMTGITVLLSDDDEKTINSGELPEDSVYYTNTNVYNNLRWGDFIALSTANRAINAVCRRFTYTVGDTDQKRTAYAVLMFEPVSPASIESVAVTPQTSLQDLLDAPQRVPTSENGKAQFEANKDKCNKFANWIYNTTDKEYITTGYLIPHAYIYAADKDVTGLMSAADWGSLSENLKTEVQVVILRNINPGSVVKWGSTLNSWTAGTARTDPDHRTAYALSDDYRVCIMGDRLYMNIGCFKNVSKFNSNGETMLRLNNTLIGAAAFTIGSTFKSKYDVNEGAIIDLETRTVVPKITVVETKSDGTVICQVGPIKGVPIVYEGSEKAVVRGFAGKVDAGKTWGDCDFSKSDDNLLLYVFEKLFANVSSYKNIDYLGLCETPYLLTDHDRKYLFDGEDIMRLNSETGGTAVEARVNFSTKTADYSRRGNSVAEYLDSVNALDGYKRENIKISTDVQTYIMIQFNACYYTVVNGYLTYDESHAADYIPPSLFTSMNDLIVNELINQNSGAVFVEQIPQGSLLHCGNGYYASSGDSSENRTFVGYSQLSTVVGAYNRVTAQDAATSFATQFIRVGNQSLNVSHFFDTFSVLPRALLDYQETALNTVRNGKFTTTQSRQCIFASVDDTGAAQSVKITDGGDPQLTYTPVEITFKRYMLLAYPVTGSEDDVPVYELCNYASESVSGALSELPFFRDNALTGSMSDPTIETASGGFIRFYGAPTLMSRVREEFKKGFAGDLFTLTRMIVFIVLVWLVVASWMCYGMYFGNLMPILDAIRYPTGSRQGKGIDLMKIVSLGSISMDTDFKLGRFIQYNLVLAVLICVVYLTGIYF